MKVLTKKFVAMNSGKVNVVGMQGKAFRTYDSNIEKEPKYLDQELAGFQA